MMNIIFAVKPKERTFEWPDSKADKAESHDRILQAAASSRPGERCRRYRSGDLMKDVGLTHGGFYRHFAWRSLAEEAVERALQEGAEAVAAAANIGNVLSRRWSTPIQRDASRRIGDKLCRHDVGGRRGPRQ